MADPRGWVENLRNRCRDLPRGKRATAPDDPRRPQGRVPSRRAVPWHQRFSRSTRDSPRTAACTIGDVLIVARNRSGYKAAAVLFPRPGNPRFKGPLVGDLSLRPHAEPERPNPSRLASDTRTAEMLLRDSSPVVPGSALVADETDEHGKCRLHLVGEPR